jgi:hypothetical protein
LERSGFDPTQWALEVPNVTLSLTVGDGAGGDNRPGSSFIIQEHVGPLIAGNDNPSVAPFPERSRLRVELVTPLAPGVTVGLAWAVIDVSPATWLPVVFGREYIFDTTMPVWIGVDPVGSPGVELVVTQEIG